MKGHERTHMWCLTLNDIAQYGNTHILLEIPKSKFKFAHKFKKHL